MGRGKAALKEASDHLGLAFDGRLFTCAGHSLADIACLDWDLDYYTSLFRDTMGRNPTSVECFDMAQSNSEHSRHWFFGGTNTSAVLGCSVVRVVWMLTCVLGC
jgi:phosphoribosylformylglycinamidine synthase